MSCHAVRRIINCDHLSHHNITGGSPADSSADIRVSCRLGCRWEQMEWREGERREGGKLMEIGD